MDGVGPEELKVRELLGRLQVSENQAVEEVILATNPSIEGDATALYLKSLIQPQVVRVTSLARGLPSGGDLEYADDATLSRALEGRQDA